MIDSNRTYSILLARVVRVPCTALICVALSCQRGSALLAPRTPPPLMMQIGPSGSVSVDRRRALHNAIVSLSSSIAVIAPRFPTREDDARAANLPMSTGADLSKTGRAASLVPLIEMRMILERVRGDLPRNAPPPRSSPTGGPPPLVGSDVVAAMSRRMRSIPDDETEFKRIFDEYSDPVSYKQKFLDQNAFLVYYTKGFDGPNRPSIESGEVPRQVLQYGARNEAWTAVDDLFAELAFAADSSSSGMDRGDGSSTTSATTIADLLDPLDRAISALDGYIGLAPPQQVEEATRLARTSKEQP